MITPCFSRCQHAPAVPVKYALKHRLVLDIFRPASLILNNLPQQQDAQRPLHTWYQASSERAQQGALAAAVAADEHVAARGLQVQLGVRQQLDVADGQAEVLNQQLGRRRVLGL